jgi:hypothetical protein
MDAGRHRGTRAGLSALTVLALVAVLGGTAPAGATTAPVPSSHSAHLRHAIAPTPQHPRAPDLQQLDASAADSTSLALPSTGARTTSSQPAAHGVNAYPAQRGRGPPIGSLA